MQIENINNMEINLDSYNLHKEYFEKYYSNSFLLNQGTDIILETINTFCPGGRWLDVGSGSTTLFWSLMTQKITSISCGDVSVEPLKILYDFVNSENEPPQCYLDIIEMYDLNKSSFDNNKKKIKEFLIFDSLKEWPKEIYENPFDFVTEFGVFGLSNNCKQFRKCFEYIKKALSDDGIAIGANWVLSKSYAQQRKHNNSYINCSEVIQACEEAGLTLLRCVEVKILNDNNYDRVVLWVAQNGKNN